jgi:hypothetical protein
MNEGSHKRIKKSKRRSSNADAVNDQSSDKVLHRGLLPGRNQYS